MMPQNGNVRGVWEEQAEAANEHVVSSATVFLSPSFDRNQWAIIHPHYWKERL